MLSKYEAIGIFASVAAMALVLAFIRFDVSELAFWGGAERQQGSVITVTENEDKEAARTDAITEAATKSGKLEKLVIEDVILGEGPAAQSGDTVTVHYEGRTQDGVRFDSSYDRGEPFTFTLGEGRVIEGWEEGVPGMKVGGKRILVIPSDLAYGNAQVGPIAPNSVLVFSVELLSIK